MDAAGCHWDMQFAAVLLGAWRCDGLTRTARLFLGDDQRCRQILRHDVVAGGRLVRRRFPESGWHEPLLARTPTRGVSSQLSLWQIS